MNLRKLIVSRFEIVSIDIFDTLIERSVKTPSDIFDLVGGYYFGVDRVGFKSERIEAEKQARIKSSTGEVTKIFMIHFPI